jgi:hypothetical protein
MHSSGGHSGCTYMTMTSPCQAFCGEIFFQLSADAKCKFPDDNLTVGSSGRECEKSLRK